MLVFRMFLKKQKNIKCKSMLIRYRGITYAEHRQTERKTKEPIKRKEIHYGFHYDATDRRAIS